MRLTARLSFFSVKSLNVIRVEEMYFQYNESFLSTMDLVLMLQVLQCFLSGMSVFLNTMIVFLVLQVEWVLL